MSHFARLPLPDRQGSGVRTLAVVNQKGGVGKTTTTVNLGHALAEAGHRVMLVDLDPQGHLSACLGLHQSPDDGVDRAMRDARPLSDLALEVRPRLRLVPCGARLEELEQRAGGVDRAYLLRNRLRQDELGADFVLIDCAPASGMLAVNAVTAVDEVLVPVAGDYLSLTGLARLMLNLNRLRALRDRPLREWVLLSRFLPRRRLAREVAAKVALHFRDRLLATEIPEAAVLAECAGSGKTIFEYRRNSPSARAFESLADDLIHGRVVEDAQEAASHVA